MHDIFFRKDNYKDEPWYNELCIFCAIGVCQPNDEHITPIQKALSVLGYETKVFTKDGKTFVTGN